MKKILFTLLIIQYSLIIPRWSGQVVQAQVQQEWVRRYPDTNTFTAGANALALDDSGNVYIAGSAGNVNFSTYCTVKYSSSGVQQWVAFYYGTNDGGRQAYAIAIDKFSNVYVTGGSYNDSSLFDYCTIKYNSSGVQQWVKYYDGSAHGIDAATKIAVDNAGNVYVTGESSLGGYSFIYTTIKYSTEGMQLWVRSYGVGGTETYARGIAVDDSCNVYVTGANNSISPTYTNAVTIKYDSSGNQLWVQTYMVAEANSIALDKYNNICVCGFIPGLITHYDYLTIKYSSSGVQQWVRRYNGDSTTYSDYEANSVDVDYIGNVYVSGFSSSDQGSAMKFCTVKYSCIGDLIWVRRDTDTLRSQNTFMTIDRNSSVYVTGSVSHLPSYSSYSTTKYDSSGSQKWGVEYNSQNGDSYPYCLKVDQNFNVLLTGGNGASMITIKYSQPVGIYVNKDFIPDKFELYQNYPNPFNPSTRFKIQIPKLSDVKIFIYDVLGKEVTILVNEQLKPGNYEVEWNASEYPSGVYFYRLEAGDFVNTKKMVLVK